MAGGWRCMIAMVALMGLCLWGYTEAIGGARSRPRPQRPPRKKPKVSPTKDLPPPAMVVDFNRMMGTWYLLNVASKCSFLLKHGTSVEPTVMTLARGSGNTISVNTKTRHGHQCWEIRQVYQILDTRNQLRLKGNRFEKDTEIVIHDTDYNSYAIMYYQKQGKLTMKLYSRVLEDLSEPLLDKFEQLAEKQNMGLAYLFPYPIYSHCEDVDQNHIINCIPTC